MPDKTIGEQAGEIAENNRIGIFAGIAALAIGLFTGMAPMWVGLLAAVALFAGNLADSNGLLNNLMKPAETPPPATAPAPTPEQIAAAAKERQEAADKKAKAEADAATKEKPDVAKTTDKKSAPQEQAAAPKTTEPKKTELLFFDKEGKITDQEKAIVAMQVAHESNSTLSVQSTAAKNFDGTWAKKLNGDLNLKKMEQPLSIPAKDGKIDFTHQDTAYMVSASMAVPLARRLDVLKHEPQIHIIASGAEITDPNEPGRPSVPVEGKWIAVVNGKERHGYFEGTIMPRFSSALQSVASSDAPAQFKAEAAQKLKSHSLHISNASMENDKGEYVPVAADSLGNMGQVHMPDFVKLKDAPSVRLMPEKDASGFINHFASFTPEKPSEATYTDALNQVAINSFRKVATPAPETGAALPSDAKTTTAPTEQAR